MHKRSKLTYILLLIAIVLIPFYRVDDANAATFTRNITAGADDGYVSNISLSIFRSTYNYALTGEDGPPAEASYTYNGWLRFTNVTIPQSAIISNATINLRTSATSFGSGIVNTVLYGVDEDDHIAPTNVPTWQTDHGIHTSASVTWNLSIVDANGSTITSPDISSIIQEIVNRSGWASGNDIGIHWDENLGDVDLAQAWATYESASYAEPQLTVTYTIPQCNDGSDNDGDGLSDYPADPGCSGSTDSTETGTAACDNGADEANDRDVLADYRLSGGDPGCTSASDTSEIDGVCDDSLDDSSDADSLADASDPGCTSTTDTSEIDAVCDDKIDNDSDTYIDYPSDGGCTGYSDTNESGGYQCQDTSDNDSDGVIDYPNDPGCSSLSDNSENSATTQCQDGVDNVDPEDAIADYPSDSGCTSPQDNDETDTTISGSLTSSIFDTGISNGVKINTIFWRGSLNGVANDVIFQIASSHCSNGATNAPTCNSNIGWGGSKVSGDGAFIGSDGTASTYYAPSDAGVAYPIPTNQHNNKRYFRYKIYLYRDAAASSPVVSDMIINWSP